MSNFKNRPNGEARGILAEAYNLNGMDEKARQEIDILKGLPYKSWENLELAYQIDKAAKNTDKALESYNNCI